MNWSLASDAGLERLYYATDVAAANGHYVLVGEDIYLNRGTVWVSEDGLHWRIVALPEPVPESLWLRSVAAGAAGFVAVGRGWAGVAGEFPPVAYFSADGLAWERVGADVFGGSDQQLVEVRPAGGQLVAFAGDGSVFTSRDGRTWLASSDADALTVGRGLRGLAVDGGSLWALRGMGEPPADTPPLEVWRTDDGQAWQRVGKIAGSSGAYDNAMAVGPAGLVVIAGARAWYSSDGVDWKQAQRPPGGALDVAADSAGYVVVASLCITANCCCAVGEDSFGGVTWTSVDGDVWRKMPDKGWRAQSIQALLIDDGMLIGLGADYRGDPFKGGLWTSLLPGSAD